jgi:hypothetical protein
MKVTASEGYELQPVQKPTETIWPLGPEGMLSAHIAEKLTSGALEGV